MIIEMSRQDDIFLPLVEGIREVEQWQRFLAALMARTQARHAVMLIAQANASSEDEPSFLHLAAPRAAHDPVIDRDLLHDIGLRSFRSLRPGRVYAIEELLDHDDPATRDRQRAMLDAQGIRFGRWMRVTVDRLTDAWILLTREREDFSSAAVATLSSTAPYVRAALRAFMALSEEQLARAMAQATLQRLGIGQIALDHSARVMVADAVAERHLGFVETPDGRPGRKLLLPAAAADRLERYCAAVGAGNADAEPVLIQIDDGMMLMLQPAALPLSQAMVQLVAIATLRIAAREDERQGAAVLRAQFRLSPREAALAQKISRGETIVEAGRHLHLTDETARNYSKRIYAQTRSRGQADLVRTILCGLAPLA
ncbi:DNA-binding CsgD family transcriptional regulator [Blastomonas natatoria]|uniref:DNA-binding CsgD family transcriptional regulator n=1 Tax=Blastomonas natatoria TaxID=34015 RepID=A0A2V3V6V1_9SPHN|nr:LuxR family transcriptional regulator [Blastomonas natatoria]PXW77552.1 DNA-binding CsgD family transcriptional regulator [Blastomonas natatoria]